eukprot:scaffold1227_cov256-Pinguiococcus_pyrenoidosus.AAC.3
MRVSRGLAKASLVLSFVLEAGAAMSKLLPEGSLPDLPEGFHSDLDEVSVSVGQNHACAIEYDPALPMGGRLRCWGSDTEGQTEPPEYVSGVMS